MLRDLMYKAKPMSSWKNMFQLVPWPQRKHRPHEIGKRIAAALPDFGRVMQVVDDEGLSFNSPSILALCPLGRIFRTPEQRALLDAYRRDEERFGTEHWMKVGWEQSDWFHSSAFRFTHSLHVPREPKHQGMVAFAESEAKLIADKFTVMKPGRYLQKYFGDKLDAKQIKELADKYVGEHMTSELRWATTQEEMIRAINLGPSESCMSAGFHDGREHWYRGHVHPAAIYATPDIHIAYIENYNGDVVARAVCNKSEQLIARIYGDERLLLPALEQLGYQQATGALDGCRINRISEDGRYIMAYVDAGIGSGGGHLYFEEYDSKYWRLTTRERGTYSTYDGYEGVGITELAQEEGEECEGCGEHTDPDDMRYVEWIDETRCRCCIEDDFRYAHVRRGAGWGGSNLWDYVPVDDAVYCESNGEWYAERYTDEYDVYRCTETGNYYALDDLVGTMDGYVYVNRAVKLDVPDSDGNEYATQSTTATTHDGRTIHEDDAVTHNDKVYHKDDDYDTEDERNESGE
jgi:hypothetical protein